MSAERRSEDAVWSPPRSLAMEVYDVLADVAGAYPGMSERRAFAHHWPGCIEYRFMGHLGGGGKVWWNGGRIYVTCYPEHLNDERQHIIDLTNEALANLLAGHIGRSNDA